LKPRGLLRAACHQSMTQTSFSCAAEPAPTTNSCTGSRDNAPRKKCSQFMELIGSVVVPVPADLYATCMNQFRVVWGRRYKLSSTAVARLPQGNLRSAVARSDEGLTGCRTWSYSGLLTRVEIAHIRINSASWQARSLVRQPFGPRIGGEDGDRPGVSPDRLFGGDECWFGEPAGRGGSYTDMVNELLPSVSSRLSWYVRRSGNESSDRTTDERGTRRRERGMTGGRWRSDDRLGMK
jgi:hypothetical protein